MTTMSALRLLSASRAQAVSPRVSGIVLAAGYGRRMGVLTQTIPKPLLPVLNCSLLLWNTALFWRSGIETISVNTHYLATAFEPVASFVTRYDLALRLHHEASLTGPFGGVLACAAGIPDGHDVVVLAGDGFYHADIRQLLGRHRQRGAALTLGVAAVEDGSRYGVLTTDRDGFVVEMVEKPRGVGRTTNASCGVYIISPLVFARMSSVPPPLDWVDVVRLLLSERTPVAIDRVEYWADAGTARDLLSANLALLGTDVLNLIADQKHTTNRGSFWTQGEGECLPNGVFKGRVLLGSNVQVGRNAAITQSIIGDGACVGQGVEIVRSLILPGATVSSGARIIDQIVA